MKVVIGYGNPLRGDDGAGPAVAEAVADLDLPGVRVRVVPLLTPELAEELADACLAVFVDAALMPEAEGVRALPLVPAARQPALGHASDPGAVLGLVEALYGRRPVAWLVRIPAGHFPFATELSPGTRRATGAALGEVLRLLAGDENENGSG